MAELSVSTLIKIIIGLVVVVAVIGGLYFAFRNNIFEHFKSIFQTVK